VELTGEVQIAGTADGAVLRLTKEISFWGGVDSFSGRITDPRHPQHDVVVTGRVLVLPATIGSSTGSSIMLELLANGCAPAALVLAEPDAILALGVVVAAEMGYPTIPVLLLSRAEQERLTTGQRAQIAVDGAITC